MKPVITTPPDSPERLLSEQEAAQLLNRSVKTIRRARAAGNGPPYIRIGRCVKYRPSDIQAYIAAHIGGGLAVLIALLGAG